MAQKLYTKKFGEIEVEQSWIDGASHIARLTNGAYVHITGLPVRTKAELRQVLPDAELVRAEHWFDHRHDDDEQAPRRIMFEADGTPVFEDGTPVESPSDLVQSLKPGPVLDAALITLATKMAAQKAAQAKAEKAGQKAAEAVAEKETTKKVAARLAKKTGKKVKPGGKKGTPATGHSDAKANIYVAPPAPETQITV